MTNHDTIYQFSYVDLIKSLGEYELSKDGNKTNKPGLDKNLILDFFQSDFADILKSSPDLKQLKTTRITTVVPDKKFIASIHLADGHTTIEIVAKNLDEAITKAEENLKLGEWATVVPSSGEMPEQNIGE